MATPSASVVPIAPARLICWPGRGSSPRGRGGRVGEPRDDADGDRGRMKVWSSVPSWPRLVISGIGRLVVTIENVLGSDVGPAIDPGDHLHLAGQALDGVPAVGVGRGRSGGLGERGDPSEVGVVAPLRVDQGTFQVPLPSGFRGSST